MPNDEALSILRKIWDATEDDYKSELDAECGPNKVCKNMEHVNYMVTREAWLEQLKKDGKYNE